MENKENDFLSQTQLQDVYSKLVTPELVLFDTINDNQFILECIEKCFDSKFKIIPTKNLQENIELLNLSFVKLLKYCQENKFKKSGQVFLGFCDYFDLDYNKTYLAFHEKLQTLIKFACKSLIGCQCYDKYIAKVNANSDVIIPTLFDLYQKP